MWSDYLITQAKGAVVSWGPRAETDQREFLEAIIAADKLVVIIATRDDMPPKEWLERFRLACPVIVYDRDKEGDKARAMAEAEFVLTADTGRKTDGWVMKL